MGQAAPTMINQWLASHIRTSLVLPWLAQYNPCLKNPSVDSCLHQSWTRLTAKPFIDVLCEEYSDWLTYPQIVHHNPTYPLAPHNLWRIDFLHSLTASAKSPHFPVCGTFQVSHIWTFSYKFLFFSRKPSGSQVQHQTSWKDEKDEVGLGVYESPKKSKVVHART